MKLKATVLPLIGLGLIVFWTATAGLPAADEAAAVGARLDQARRLMGGDPAAAEKEALQALARCGEGLPALRLDAWLLLGRIGYAQGRLDEVENRAGQALELARQLKDDARRLDAVYLQVAVWNARNDFKRAEQSGSEALADARRLGLKPQIIALGNALGAVYSTQALYEPAIAHYLTALRAAEESGDSGQQAAINNNLANLYLATLNYPKGLECSDHGIEMAARGNDRRVLATLLITRASVLERLGRVDEEVTVLERALAIGREIGLPQVVTIALGNLADLYLNQKQYGKAIAAAAEAESLSASFQDPVYTTVFQVTRAQALSKLGKSRQAIPILQQALRTFVQSKRPYEAMQIRGYLAEAFEEAGLSGEALAAQKEFKRESDRLLLDDKQKAVAEIQEKYEADKRRKEIDLLSQENRLQTAQLQRRQAQRNILLVAVLAALVIAGLLLQRYRHSRRTNRQLQDLNQQLHELSLADALTGLHNRRYFHLRIDHDLALARRRLQSDGGVSLGFFMVDIDHFKAINDREGHRAGDRVLKEFSARLKQIVRESDILVRWGGEEFLAMTRDVTPAGAAELARRLVEGVRRTPFDVGGREIPITCSVGYCRFPFTGIGEGSGWEETVALADAALYEAKRRGRDRAVGVQPGRLEADHRMVPAVLNDFAEAVRSGLVVLD